MPALDSAHLLLTVGLHGPQPTLRVWPCSASTPFHRSLSGQCCDIPQEEPPAPNAMANQPRPAPLFLCHGCFILSF